MSENEEPLEEHSDYPNILDLIEKYANLTKKQLVNMNYDGSGNGYTKKELQEMSRGELLVLAVDGHFGGTCQ